MLYKHLKKAAIILSAAVLTSAGLCAALFPLSGVTASADENNVLEGEGTYENPYVINGEDDLIAFAADVNGGNSYKGKFVKQTSDIDLNGKNFTPIGECGGGSYFDGTYLGAGHAIYNLTIDGDNAYGNALFGTLNGEVYSLSIRGGKISGKRAAAIAVTSEDSDAIIAGCYTDVTLSGERVAGIADDFSGGSLLACISLSENVDGTPASLCSYSAGKIRLSYSAGEVFGGIFCDVISDNKSYAKNVVSSANFHSTINSALRLLYMDNALSCALAPYKSTLEYISDDSPTATYFSGGDGSKYNPYKITTANDVTDLSRFVNGGEIFRNAYFKQTENIDMAGADFIPIGLYGEGSYFYGTYDGGGHTISGLNITTDRGMANNGFFGMLGGKALNLGLTDGYVTGNCCGSIASHAADAAALIVNCYSTLAVEGSRSGGIADNFVGSIAGCWYYNDELALPIVSYNAKAVKYCHNNYLYILPDTFDGAELSNFCIEMKIFSQDDFKNTVNGNLAFLSYETGISISSFTKCYSTEYANGFEHIFAYPRQTFLAFRLYYEASAVMAVCAAVIVVTLVIQRRKNKNEVK